MLYSLPAEPTGKFNSGPEISIRLVGSWGGHLESTSVEGGGR